MALQEQTFPAASPKPSWLRARAPGGPVFLRLKATLATLGLHTVCESACCPNIGECWGQGAATLMILGDTCTRSCRFCAVSTGRPGPPNAGEPIRVALAMRLMGLRYAVITSVARDDLPDGGATHWAQTVRETRKANPSLGIEVLLPDFRGRWHCLQAVLEARPDVVAHNVETVPRLQKEIRPQARYDRSLELLRRAREAGFLTKTGLMLGIGEEQEEIKHTLEELARIPVDILTLGQYLRPSANHRPVHRWVPPEEFERWRLFALELGFRAVAAGPLVRSSYRAEEQARAAGWTGRPKDPSP